MEPVGSRRQGSCLLGPGGGFLPQTLAEPWLLLRGLTPQLLCLHSLFTGMDKPIRQSQLLSAGGALAPRLQE